MECLSSVIDPKDQHANKYNYVVASQDDRVRAMMRSIPGVPLIYIKRSVMILEPMAGASENVKSKEERGKFKLGISRTGGRANVLGKRSREDGDTEGTRSEHGVGDVEGSAAKKKRGVREPNPLSMRKPKARETSSTTMASPSSMAPSVIDEGVGKKKRKRKHKDRSEAGANGVTATAGDMSDG
jgi:U3 small nucleolar RNA-associated protein 23